MVAPEKDFESRSAHRNDRAFVVFAEPARAAEAVLYESRSWLALRGLAAFACAMGFLWPGIPESMVVRLFAAYALVDGMLALRSGAWGRHHRLAWPLLIGGCIDIAGACAVYLWLWSGTGLLFADIAAVWAICGAAAYTLACATLRASDTDQLFLLCGIASLVFGRALLSHLASDPVVLSAWMGLYAMTMAVLFLKLTLKQYRVALL